jgi:F-type H+-transporting ATPase subunit delta
MEEIAQVYARSLFEVATEHDNLDVVRDQLAEFVEALDGSHELQMFFFSPYFSTDEKQEGLRQTVTEADESFLNFLSLLLENHRMPVIFRVRREYDRLWREANQLLAVQITSAVELDPSVAERVGDEIGRQTGRTVELTSNVDPEILGGIVVRVGNSIIDASIRTRLDNLRKQVVNT